MVWTNNWQSAARIAERLTERFPAGTEVVFRMVKDGVAQWGRIASSFEVRSDLTILVWVNRGSAYYDERLPMALIEIEGRPIVEHLGGAA